jgi:hypothetical protein
MESTVDRFGEEVKVGDWVICNKMKYYELAYGKVLSITPKGFVKVGPAKAINRFSSYKDDPVIRYEFVKMSDKQIKSLQESDPELFNFEK